MSTRSDRRPSRPEQARLFETPADEHRSATPAEPPVLYGRPRLRTANRDQIVFRAAALDELIPPDHPARVVWDYTDGLDLSSLYNLIKSVEGNPGRPPIDPKILMALWLYATIDGVGSARQLDELCRSHSAYQWICGDVSVNYHTLSDFRTDHGELLDRLLTQSVAVLLAEGLVDLNRVAQDRCEPAPVPRRFAVVPPWRTPSPRPRPKSRPCGRNSMKTLRPAIAGNKRPRARVAKSRVERIKGYSDHCCRSWRPRRSRKIARRPIVRPPDPDATVMKMPDGGFRPAAQRPVQHGHRQSDHRGRRC